MPRKPDPEVAQLVFALDRSFSGKAWHGPTLLGSLRGITAAEALARPPGIAHPIWQQVRHAAYWKYAACVRLGAAEPNTFPYAPSNWPGIPATPDARAWSAERKLLADLHGKLIRAVAAVPARNLDRVPPRGKNVTVRLLVTGVAAHDAYHTGQIQLTKALVRRAAKAV